MKGSHRSSKEDTFYFHEEQPVLSRSLSSGDRPLLGTRNLTLSHGSKEVVSLKRGVPNWWDGVGGD